MKLFSKEYITLFCVTLVVVFCCVQATPIAKFNNNNNHDNIPNIDDILAVAKSPLEPITVAMSLPGARNDGGPTTKQLDSYMTTKSELLMSEHKQTSRAALFVEQEKESTTSSSLSSSTTTLLPVSSEQTQETTTVATSSSDSTETDSSMTETDSTEAPKEKEMPVTTMSTTTITSTTTTTTTTEKPEPITTTTSDNLEPTTTEAQQLSTAAVTSNSETSSTFAPSASTEVSNEEAGPGNDNNPATATKEQQSSTASGSTNPVSIEQTSTTETPLPTSTADIKPEKENKVEPTTTEQPLDKSTSIGNEESSEKDDKLAITTTEPELPTTTTITITSTTAIPTSSSTLYEKVEEPTTTTTTTPSSVTSITELVEISSTTTELPLESTTASEPKVQDESVINEKESTSADIENFSTTGNPTTTTTTAAPPMTTSAPTSTTTTTTEKPAEKEEKENSKSSQSCNHLPTYEQDELQKVFREETTYKNGTIKGKFTYINYDQRYRLVHYTRLPYGPVKIDLVEELGRPEQQSRTQNGNNNQSGTSIPNSNQDAPNAVLQLRNILPNSLFGFPFLGPLYNQQHLNQANNNNNNNPLTPKDDKSNQYFYSTDSISTPNLLTPSVPVSLLPGQRRASQQQNPLNAPAADTLSQSYYENLPINSINKNHQQPSDSTTTHAGAGAAGATTTTTSDKVANKITANVDIDHKQQAHNNQFQYALVSQSEVAKHQPGLVYTYIQPQLQAQPQTQYQYSPIPLFHTFNHHPSFYPTVARQQQSTPALISIGSPIVHQATIQKQLKALDQQENQNQELAAVQQAHQPHSHEHFVAPFMLAKPPITSLSSSIGQNTQQPLNDEPDRLKLRVKTSKSLNHQESFGKSAQIKASQQQQQSPSTYLQSPFYNPIQILRYNQRHRSGKQQQFDSKQQNINTNPIVYHVLRSPVGKMYNLQQYQAHSLAYDHDS